MTGNIQVATISITIALANAGVINLWTAVPIVLGDNIGTTVTALLASIGTNANARRAALAHALFNIIGTLLLVMTFVLVFVEGGVKAPAFFHLVNACAEGNAFLGENPGLHVAMAHTLFNVTNVVVLAFFIPLLARLCSRIIRDNSNQKVKALEACPYFAIRLGDRFVYERSRGRGDLVPEHRPTLDVVLTTPEFLTLKLDSRTRFEYRMIDGKDDHMRYRERLRLKTEWSVTRRKISTFVSEELFFSDRQGGSAANAFVRNRAQIGFSFVPFPSLPALVCNTYYMVQHDWAESGWEPINVYGLECAYKF